MPGRMFVRFILLQKRLLKRYSFLLMLCLAPLLSAGVGRLSEESAGIATIALYLPEGDAAAQAVSERLLDGRGVLRYLSCENEEEARMQVETGKADAAWIFSEDLSEQITALAQKRRVRPVVTVVERRDSVALTLGREILSSAIYPSFSYAVYAGYVREELGFEEMTDEELRRIYDRMAVEGSLFQMVYPDETSGEAEDFTYVQAPLRGILALWFTFVGLAASLCFMQDEERGVYGRIPVTRRLSASYIAGAVFLLDAALVLLLSCKLVGGVYRLEEGSGELRGFCSLRPGFCKSAADAVPYAPEIRDVFSAASGGDAGALSHLFESAAFQGGKTAAPALVLSAIYS